MHYITDIYFSQHDQTKFFLDGKCKNQKINNEQNVHI